MARTEDDLEPMRPVGRPQHQIGEPLDLLSIEEIDQRIALLRSEIARLEAQRAGKQASRRDADSVFRR